MRNVIIFICVISLSMIMGCGKKQVSESEPVKPQMVEKSAEQAPAMAEKTSEPAQETNKSNNVMWSTDFKDVENWYDASSDPSFNATITLKQGNVAEVKEVGDGDWGKVTFVFTNIDFSRNPAIILNVDSLSPGAAWSAGVDTLKWDNFKRLVETTKTAGKFEIDLSSTGWRGVRSFNFIFIVEGNDKSVTLSSASLVYKK